MDEELKSKIKTLTFLSIMFGISVGLLIAKFIY